MSNSANNAVPNKLMSFEEARERLLDSAQALTATDIETCPLNQLVGRIAAKDVISELDIPPYDNSAMDGYALSLAKDCEQFEVGQTFDVLTTIYAGHPSDIELTAGTCARIMTGAAIPKGTDAVVMQEFVSIQTGNSNEQVTLDSSVKNSSVKNSPVKLGEHIRPCGEDVTKNQAVFKAGHEFSAKDIGLLATIGIEKASVYRRLRIAFLSTGDELQQPGTPLKQGQIYDSNRPMMQAILQPLPVELIDFGAIKDDPESLRQALTKASQQADLIVSSAGVSVGDADHVKDILDELGEIGFWKVAIKPGKPFALGQIGNAAFMGLPGNPVSVAISCEQLVIPYLKKRANFQQPVAPTYNATLLESYSRKAGRKEFLRGLAHRDPNGLWQVSPVKQQGSGMLNGLSQANCHLILEADCDKIEAGQQVEIMLYEYL